MIFERATHTSSTHGKYTDGWNLHPRSHKPESNIGQSFWLPMTAESVFELHGEAGFAKDTTQEKGHQERLESAWQNKSKETQKACGHSVTIWRPRNSSG